MASDCAWACFDLPRRPLAPVIGTALDLAYHRLEGTGEPLVAVGTAEQAGAAEIGQGGTAYLAAVGAIGPPGSLLAKAGTTVPFSIEKTAQQVLERKNRGLGVEVERLQLLARAGALLAQPPFFPVPVDLRDHVNRRRPLMALITHHQQTLLARIACIAHILSISYYHCEQAT